MTLSDRLPPGPDPDTLVEVFAEWAFEEQGISLYPAQEEALLELVTGANVILSTPTGSGKSLVAIGAHAAALGREQRTFYTAPIKALVSEKFFALIDVFGAEKVGHAHRRRRGERDRADHLLHRGDPGEHRAAQRALAPTSAASSWTSSTSTRTRSAAGPGRCR